MVTGGGTAAVTEPASRGGPADPGGSAQPGAPGPQGDPAHPGGPASRWTTVRRRFGLPVILVVIVVLGAIAVSALSRQSQANSFLNPANNGPDGSHALTDILGERGFHLTSAHDPGQAAAVVQAARGGVTLVVTSPWLLSRAQLRLLAGLTRADLLLVEPGQAALAELAPQLSAHAVPRYGHGALPDPACGLPAAQLAGSVNVNGYSYAAPPGAIGCYPVAGYPTLVRYQEPGRTVTVLGSSDLLTNADLAANGNAALALNLLRSNRRIVWLTPQQAPAAARPASPRSGQGSAAPSLLPAGVSLLLLQLFVVLALAVAWRGRRLGPLITERLLVVVRASETVEGHARLYQSRRAAGRAAAVLRESMVSRIRPAVGLAGDASPHAVVQALASRSALSEQDIAALVFGPPPASEAELVRLARRLDELEREVRSQ